MGAMTVAEYFSRYSRILREQSEGIRNEYSSHKPTSGSNRENLVAKFFQKHLPDSFGVGAGLVISTEGSFSNQADVIIYNRLLNMPLNSDYDDPLFLIESVYAIIEVKTKLTPSELKSSLDKCRKFKNMPRKFLEGRHTPSISSSLFIIFAFEAATPETFKQTFSECINDIPIEEQPDIVISQNSFVISSGQYRDILINGQPGSSHRALLEEMGQNYISLINKQKFEILNVQDNALLIFFIWLSSWLQHSGPRSASLLSYLPQNHIWGHYI